MRVRFADTRPGSDITVLLAPWPESLWAFRRIWSRVSAVGRVVAIDLPGFGHSDGRSELIAPDTSGAFLARLIDEWGLGAPYVVGPDVGTAAANLNPWTEAKVDTKNPDRGPLLIIDGEMDHTVPWAVANASYKRQKRNPAVTEIVKIPGRGHSLTIDHGWREVADTALTFVQKHAQP